MFAIGAIVASAAPAAASGSIVIDRFAAGSGTWSACGNSVFNYLQDGSIIGGARELELRDAGSCHFGPYPASLKIDAAAGTATWYGNHTYSPEQVFSYGTEIGTHDVPWSPSPNKGKGTPLHLALTLSDQILVQMVQVQSPYLAIRLRGSNGTTYTASTSLAAGTNTVPLSAFPGLTAAAAAHIDGISFMGSANSGPGDTVSMFGIKPGDSDPPAASPTQAPAANGNGWNNTDVTVAWNWTDAGTGIDAANCTQSSTSTGEGAITLTSTCKDNAGNEGSASQTVHVDKTAPTAAPSAVPAWSNADVTVAWNWTDGGSGIDASSCTQSSTSSGEGAITLTSTCSDLAGNSASDSVTVHVDKTPPAAAPSAVPAWSNSDVTVDWNWTDGGSGIDAANCTQSSTSTGEGAITLTSTCQDAVGNSASDSVTVHVDKTAPTVTFSPNGQTYDVNDTVSITCSATDALSGVASTTCADVSGPAWSLGLGTHTLSADATDNAGNTGSGSGSYTVQATANGVCALAQQWVSKPGVASSLCAKLQAAAASRARGNAQAADNQLAAFRNELDAQTGKSISADRAATLAQLSHAL